MSERDLFPYRDDREIMAAFLCGWAMGSNPEHRMVSTGQALAMDDTTMAFYDTAGALMGSVTGSYPLTTMRVLNVLSEMVGSDTLLRYDNDSVTSMRWFAGDQPVNIGTPFVILGSLGVQAFRASKGVLGR